MVDQTQVWSSGLVSRATVQGSSGCPLSGGQLPDRKGIGGCHLHSEVLLFIVDSELTGGLRLFGWGTS